MRKKKRTMLELLCLVYFILVLLVWSWCGGMMVIKKCSCCCCIAAVVASPLFLTHIILSFEPLICRCCPRRCRCFGGHFVHYLVLWFSDIIIIALAYVRLLLTHFSSRLRAARCWPLSHHFYSIYYYTTFRSSPFLPSFPPSLYSSPPKNASSNDAGRR